MESALLQRKQQAQNLMSHLLPMADRQTSREFKQIIERQERELQEARQHIEHLELQVQSLRQDRKVLQEQVAYQESCQDVDQYNADLLSRMNHELRTPLNSIIGFANLLLADQGASRSEVEKTFLNRIVENGRHLNELISQILDVSRLEAGTIPLEYEAVDISMLVSSVLDSWEDRFARKGLSLSYEATEHSGLYPTDPSKLIEVLNHLISNAYKFTPEGSVSVTVCIHAESGWPEEIRVDDTGIGITDQPVGQMFGAFHQNQTGTNRSFAGLGLGLSLCESLCEMLGLELVLEPRDEGGTSARIRFPKTDQLSQLMNELLNVPPQPQEAPCESDTLKGRHVLVLTDDFDSQILIAQQIQKSGGHVVQALRSADAYTFLQSDHFDLLLIDPNADSATGFTVLNEFHERGECPPVILLSDRPDSMMFRHYPISGHIGPREVSEALVPMLCAVLNTSIP